MNILFIDPYLSETESNVGLGYLCGVLKAHGHYCRVVKGAESVCKVSRIIMEEQPDIVGFSIKSSTVLRVIDAAMEVRKSYDGPIICGGPHITIDGEAFLNEHSCFDIGVAGEGEDTILEIIDYLLGNRKLEEIKGIIARSGDGLLRTELRAPVDDLDMIPFPDYTHFDIFSNGMKVYWVCTSRGCPFKCTFCNVPSISGRKWRFRSVSNIIEELEHALITHPGIQCIDIADDNFTFDISRVKEFCMQLIKKKLNFRWKCSNGIRADRIDEELVSLMKDSGCTGIDFGIESGSPAVFAGIKKGETLKTIEESVNMVKAAGMRVAASFIIGLPGSDFQSDMESIAFAKKLNLDAVWFNLFCPFKKTEGYDILMADNSVRFLRDWKNVPFMFHKRKVYCIFETDDYLCKERISAFMKGNLQLFNYNFIRDYSVAAWSPLRLLPLFASIVKYDIRNTHKHISRMTREMFSHVKKLFRK
ncbi:MAG: radical SAM protein [Candidatus Aegiribacteria sp.]|nr:radical SAM protein [Candidatus Aegiribacteria sp.]